MNFDLDKHTILKVVHGSKLYGTNTPTSDTDYKGCAVSPLPYYLGVSKTFEQAEKYENKGADCDEVIYDIRKYCKLAADGNPTILETLFIPEECIIVATELGKLLLENNELFLSQKTFHTHHGFAFSQLKRLENHKAWMRNPLTHQPTREEFGLSDVKIKNDDIGIINVMIEQGIEISGHLNEILNKEKRYQAALKNYQQYQSWFKNRNQERFVSEQKHGYDLKFAVHIIRLYMNCEEILVNHTLNARRPPEDLKILMDIRAGKYSYSDFMNLAKEYEQKCEKAKQHTKLRHTADHDSIDDLCQDIIKKFHNLK